MRFPASFPSGLRRKKPAARRPAGLSPGAIVLHEDARDLSFRLSSYDRSSLDEAETGSIDELAELLEAGDGEGAARDGVTWLRVVGHGDARRLMRLGDLLDLHPLILEDVAHVDQRPKVEISGGDWIAFARVCEEEPTHTPIASWQVAILLRPGMVITFEEHPTGVFDPVLRRIRSDQPRLRTGGADYLAYALLDALVDRYLLLLETYRDHLDQIEETILEEIGDFDLQALHRLRRDLLRIHRLSTPLRDMLGEALKVREGATGAGAKSPGATGQSTAGFGETVRHPYLADCHDHAMRLASQAEGLRDVASSLLDLHLSMVGHRTNEVMKVLTMIGSIFIPLSFLAGLYGMNFDTSSPWNMPELAWDYGYPVVVGVMLLVAVGLVGFFRRRGWF